MISSPEEFIQLRFSEKKEEQYRSSHDLALEGVWLELIEKFPDMRELVAHNKTVKGKILEILADDSNVRVRRTISRRRATSQEILQKFTKDKDEIVKRHVVCHPKATKKTFMLLLDDCDIYIREKAQERIHEMNQKILKSKE